ncbi:hypothetical protein TWF730_006032 [Orbilia blumenaviensis]|uniref:Uncharacterized protein n=1 Tax=Orbilia blumenaviensis TaxID=1796055 RepID=A0AAV9VLH5_9PEZI
MPAPKRRHQRDPVSERQQLSGDPPEPKRHQGGIYPPGSSVTQGQSSTTVTPPPPAISSNPSLLPSPSLPIPQTVQLGTPRQACEEGTLNMEPTPEPPNDDEESLYHTQESSTPSSRSPQPRDGTATEPDQATAQSTSHEDGLEEVLASAAIDGVYPPLPVQAPPPPPPIPPIGSYDVGSSASPGSGYPHQIPPSFAPPIAEDAALWGGLSEAEIRRQINMLEALERRRHESIPPVSEPLPPLVISSLPSPPTGPQTANLRQNRLGPPPLPPGSNPAQQASPFQPILSGPHHPTTFAPPPGFSRLGPPPLPPSPLPGSQPPGLFGPVLPQPHRPLGGHGVFNTAPPFPQHFDHNSLSEGARSRRGATSIHFDDSDPFGSGTRSTHTSMRGTLNQPPIDPFRSPLSAPQGFDLGLPTNTNNDTIGLLQRLFPSSSLSPSSRAKKAHSAPSDKGKRPETREEPYLTSSEITSRIRQLRRLQGVHDYQPTSIHPGSTTQDPTFRFSPAKAQYEAVVPMAYFMNNPNTRPLSTTDPFFRSFPSDPEEITSLRGTRLAKRPPTPEIRLDETPVGKKEYTKRKRESEKKQDWSERREVSLPRSWHLQYSSRSRTMIGPGGHIVSSSSTGRGISLEGALDDGGLQEQLEIMRREYIRKRQAVSRVRPEGEDSNSATFAPFSELGASLLRSTQSRRTGRPEESQPLEVGREPENVSELSWHASPPLAGASSADAPTDEASEQSQRRRKESRTRK